MKHTQIIAMLVGFNLVTIAWAQERKPGEEALPMTISATAERDRLAATASDTLSVKTKVTVFSSPHCNCCHDHIAYLDGLGYTLEIVHEEAMSKIKDRYGIPAPLRSCHTSLVENYVVEGHVPDEAIRKLLQEKPDIRGIALPDMPSGAPGTSGSKKQPFTIHIITLDGKDGGVFMEM